MMVLYFSRIPIYSWKYSKFPAWIKALKKEAIMHHLTSAVIVNLAYDYFEGIFSEYIDFFLDQNPEASWTNLLIQLTTQFGEYVSSAVVAW